VLGREADDWERCGRSAEGLLKVCWRRDVDGVRTTAGDVVGAAADMARLCARAELGPSDPGQCFDDTRRPGRATRGRAGSCDDGLHPGGEMGSRGDKRCGEV
jgi:hypothetical protein